ncbi:hypothetical protein [Escherichia coli]|uniref:hypothetical protein n=1 Tax=Escherichia coli TaxID=562 RepID=UPI001181A257|nr:hypothetical protein [Escherichia coli]
MVNLKQQEWIKPAQVNANSPVENTVKGTSDIHVDLGDDPRVTAPDLAEPPTGETNIKADCESFAICQKHEYTRQRCTMPCMGAFTFGIKIII